EVFGTYHRHAHRPDGVTSFQVDLVQGNEILDLIARVRPDTILYAAGLNCPEACESERGLAESLNFKASTVFKLAPLPLRFIYFSTDEVFGSAPSGPARAFAENDTPVGMNTHSRTKAQGESAALLAGKGTAVFRVGSLFGESFWAGSRVRRAWMSTLIERLSKGQSLILPKDYVRSFLYLGDLARAVKVFLKTFSYEAKPELYHLAAKDFLSAYDLGLVVAKGLGVDPDLVQAGTRSVDFFSGPVNCPLDASRFTKKFGFEFQTIEHGVGEMLERLRTGRTGNWPL
ncbi:NAD-dependent epimerase/dehydratase family protein, partial [bacterium]|nr:NAD-dependent epimerase/dehydratase family protein [bacterium]